ncbi:MAG TPA: hypothetical protein DCM54_06650 [Gammaproteobacteria bacterium]|nr:hypothetical protein [Gammaproteobacteria bacterium]
MHDIVWFEIQGMPSVAIASTEFADAAETQADALGMSDAKRVLVQHPIQDANPAQMCAKADAIVDQVIAALSN